MFTKAEESVPAERLYYPLGRAAGRIVIHANMCADDRIVVLRVVHAETKPTPPERKPAPATVTKPPSSPFYSSGTLRCLAPSIDTR